MIHLGNSDKLGLFWGLGNWEEATWGAITGPAKSCVTPLPYGSALSCVWDGSAPVSLTWLPLSPSLDKVHNTIWSVCVFSERNWMKQKREEGREDSREDEGR